MWTLSGLSISLCRLQFDDAAVRLDDDECDGTKDINAQEGLENVLSTITKVSHIQ